MTNHSDTTGPSDNSDITAGEGDISLEVPAFTEHQVTLRTPSELADALPYLLGYRPEDSIVLVALSDENGRGRFGGRARLGIPTNPDDWPSAAGQLVHGLVTGSERRGSRPGRMVVYLCQEPATGESGRQVMERLRPLAHKVRLECGGLDVPVVEALCISDGRFWSYCCDNEVCCPANGVPMGLPGTSVIAAAATYAGIQVRGTLRDLRARLLPREDSAMLEQEIALDARSAVLVPRMFDPDSRADVVEETLHLAERVMSRFAATPPAATVTADLRDDELLPPDDAAILILGLQDRHTRDRAAEWMEGTEAGLALRLWRALARRCAGPYGEHAASPLTLAGWVAWSTGDELEAREALAMALGADPEYLFARLLHQACNQGLDPESIRRCLRAERAERGEQRATGTDSGRLSRKAAGGERATSDDKTPDNAPESTSGKAPESGTTADPAPDPGSDLDPGPGHDADSGSALIAEATRRPRRARAEGTAGNRHRPPHRSPNGTRPRDTRPDSRPRPAKKDGGRRGAPRSGAARGGSGQTEGEA
ncbi:DUF4192 family protein [Streptomyces sp. NPDC005925]|uniref:DUF4192 domain-containing protein n=1 Tax=Streptomyces sp. NPDC005925 TaxID=3157172 RepID=UPI0033CB998D